MPERFERHTRTLSVLTLVSRMTGLARDAALSRIFGAGLVPAAFFFAFIIPNLFRRLFGEGALAAAFLPVYARLDKDDPATARRLATLTVGLLLVVLGAVTLAGELVLYLVSRQLDQQNLALHLTMIMLPYLPLVCMVAILGAMLQVHGRFGPTAAAPVLLNASVIAAAVGMRPLFDNPREHIGVVAIAVVAAGLLQVSWSLWALRNEDWPQRGFRETWGPLRTVLGRAGPMILGLGVLQLNTFFDALIASYPTTVGPTIFGVRYPLSEGAMAAVSFAQRLYQFPLGVFGIAVATAIFPALARQNEDPAVFGDLLRRGLRLVMFIGLPASAGLLLVARPLTAVILEGGDFTARDSQRVAFILIGYASAVWAYSMIHVLIRAFYARGDVRTPVKVAVWMVALNLVLNCTLIWTPLRESGLAWSTAVCATIQMAVLLALLRRQAGGLVTNDVVASWTRTALITGVMIALVTVASVLLPTPSTWSGSLLELGVLVGLGMMVVVGAARAIRMPELAWALGRAGETSDV